MSQIASRLDRRENNIRTQTALEVRYEALQDLGHSLKQAARDLKRVILNGDATPDDLDSLLPEADKEAKQ